MKEYIGEKLKSGIDKSEYERTKKVVWGDYIRSYNDVEEFSHSFLNMYMMGSMYTDFEKVYEDITFADVKARFADLYNEEYAALSVVNPV